MGPGSASIPRRQRILRIGVHRMERVVHAPPRDRPSVCPCNTRLPQRPTALCVSENIKASDNRPATACALASRSTTTATRLSPRPGGWKRPTMRATSGSNDFQTSFVTVELSGAPVVIALTLSSSSRYPTASRPERARFATRVHRLFQVPGIGSVKRYSPGGTTPPYRGTAVSRDPQTCSRPERSRTRGHWL